MSRIAMLRLGIAVAAGWATAACIESGEYTAAAIFAALGVMWWSVMGQGPQA